jgi:transcription antitermination factor NusG
MAAACPDEVDMTLTNAWYALQVKPRTELSVARQLQSKGYEQFVPLYRSRRRWADRMKEVEVPLFPHYVFCRTTMSTVGKVVTTMGVIRIVGAGKVPIPIDNLEIEALQRVAKAQFRAEPSPYLQVGRLVELGAGPLQGIRGVLTSFANGDRLIVSISLLQRSVSVAIGASDVLPLKLNLWAEPSVGCARAHVQ